jgi:hypothetical protein
MRLFDRLRRSSSRMPRGRVARWATALAGVSLLATGAVAVFVATNTTGTAALIAAGLVLVAIATYGDRIQSFEAAGIRVVLNEVAEKLEAAGAAEAAGDLDTANRLRSEAAQLLEAARSVATRYETIRATMGPGWERTERLEELIQQEVRALSGAVSSREAVRELFRAGKDGYRIVAIGMMSANPALADPETIAEAITTPRSAFELYHALRAAEVLARRPLGRDAVRDAVDRALKSDKFTEDSDRGRLAHRVLELLT